MSSLFGNVMRQALKTFDYTNQAALNANLAILKQLTDQLTPRDILLNQQELVRDFERPNKAPCSFIHIFENETVSMSVFVLRAGYTMPLHDHPMMHGLLRGIFGQMRVHSYTQQLSAHQPLVYDPGIREIFAIAEQPVVVSAKTDCAMLTPHERNYHEITALDDVAAFFDILSPPYVANMPQYGSRRCRFYRTTPMLTRTELPLLRLERIPTPATYYCDTVEASQALIDCTLHCYAESG